VVPAADYAVALAAGRAFGGVTERRTAEKLGVGESEVERLREAVVEALGTAPMDPKALHAAAGDAVRNLGEEGRKRGLATTLPLALGDLQAAGRIRRVPINGRLDQQRYAYALWQPGPFGDKPLDDAEAYVELARRFFRWAAPATPADFQWFSGLGKRAAAEAISALELVPLEPGDARLISPADLEALRSFVPAAAPQYSLVGSIDNIAHLRRDAGALVDDADRHFVDAGTTPGNLADLPHHAILDRGRLVGMWDFDPQSASMAWTTFRPPDGALRDAVARTEAFVRDELGDARSFSLDSPASRVTRLEALRGMA
jgi:hypothetical protein